MTTPASVESRQYEIMFIIAGDKTDDVIKEANKAIKEEITSRGGKVLHEDSWGLREFSYPIKRQTTGYYTVLVFELPSQKLNDFSKHLRLNTSFLRFLVTSLPPKYEFLTHTALMEKARKKETGREADSIRAESTQMKRRPAPVAAAPMAPKAAPIAAPVEQAKPEKKTVAQSDDDRLKELDQKLEELIKTDEI